MTLHKLNQYGKKFQIKVLASLLTDRKFLLSVRDVLNPEFFDSDSHKWIVSQVCEYFDKYHTTLTLEVIKTETEKISNDILKVALKGELRNCYSVELDDKEYIQEEFLNFCRNQKMKQAILESTDLLELGDFDGIRSLIEKAIKAGSDRDLGHEYGKDIESRYREDYRVTVPTPWEALNNLTQGGLGAGDLFIVFGNPGGGKSWTMVAMAGYAAQMGFNVNYYTLELGQDYVGKRVDCYLTGYGIEEIASKREEVQKVLDELKGNIIIKEYAPKTASVNTIRSHIQRCTDMGYKPDLVIIDYVDYLKAPSRGKYADKKDEVDDVFIGTKSLAKQLQIPIVTPSQVNRSGAKDSVIEGDKAAGSYDKIMISDVSISLSRQKEDKVLGTGRVHIMKNRYGQDGMTYNVTVNTNNGHIDFEGEFEESDDSGMPMNLNLPEGVLKKFLNK